MEWQAWSQRLTEVLGLRRAPVAVTYTDTPPAGADTGKCRACRAIVSAAEGAVIDLSTQNTTCPGGSTYLGLRPPDPEGAKTLRNFLINGEKLFSCPASIYRMNAMSKVKPPLGMATHIVFAPVEKATLQPDIAIFTCNAWQAARLVSLAWFEDGLPMECDPTGALCKSVVTYPLVTGKVNISFGDITARKGEKVGVDELWVTLPFMYLRSVMASLERCSAGVASAEVPPDMQRLIEASGSEPHEL
jgi:uncharacterized protein (DUF169 family)